MQFPPSPFYNVEIRIISFLNWHLNKQHCNGGGGGENETPSLAWFRDQACFQYVFRNQVGLLKKSPNISSKIVAPIHILLAFIHMLLTFTHIMPAFIHILLTTTHALLAFVMGSYGIVLDSDYTHMSGKTNHTLMTPILGWRIITKSITFHDSCGKEAKRAGYKYFLIEFYGECWGYKDFPVNKPHAGAKKCWGKRPNYETCIHNQKNPICVGTGFHGYVYQLGWSRKHNFKLWKDNNRLSNNRLRPTLSWSPCSWIRRMTIQMVVIVVNDTYSRRLVNFCSLQTSFVSEAVLITLITWTEQIYRLVVNEIGILLSKPGLFYFTFIL